MTTIILKYSFYAIVGVILFLIVGHFYKLEKESIKGDFVAEQTKVVADEKAKDEVATDKLETKYETITKVEIKYVDRIVTKKVIEYRDRVTDRCLLDPEWVRVYNLSTDSASQESASGEPDGAGGTIAKAVDDAKALEVATTNNRICVAEIKKLTALQEWAKLPLSGVSQDGK